MAHKNEKEVVESISGFALRYKKTIIIYTVIVTGVEILNNVISILSNLGVM